MALNALIDECTLPPREARVEDFYDDLAGARSYAKVAILYDDCEAAKRALMPGTTSARSPTPRCSPRRAPTRTR